MEFGERSQNDNGMSTDDDRKDDGDWDAVVNVEGNAYQQGYAEGVKDAIEGDAFRDGYETGVSKGYSVGAELSFIETIVRMHMEKASSQPSTTISERNRKRISTLLEQISSYPAVATDPEYEYNEKLEEIRAVFRSLNTGISGIKPVDETSTIPTHEW
jgi:hypothetical protein